MTSSAAAALRRLRCTAAHVRPAPPLSTAPSSAAEVDEYAELRGGAVSRLQGRVDGPFSDDDLRFWADNGYVRTAL